MAICGGTPAIARNQLIRAATASLNACAVVPGMFESTLPVQPVGTVMFGQNARFQESRTAVRVEVSYQPAAAGAANAGAFPANRFSSNGRSWGAAGGSPISGSCACKDDTRPTIRGTHRISDRQVLKNPRSSLNLQGSWSKSPEPVWHYSVPTSPLTKVNHLTSTDSLQSRQVSVSRRSRRCALAGGETSDYWWSCRYCRITLSCNRRRSPIANQNSRCVQNRCPVDFRGYCPKYAEISKIRCVRLLANALIDPFVVGTIARFEVIAPSTAFSVDTVGRVCPCGHNVKYPSGVGGTTVTLKTCA